MQGALVGARIRARLPLERERGHQGSLWFCDEAGLRVLQHKQGFWGGLRVCHTTGAAPTPRCCGGPLNEVSRDRCPAAVTYCVRAHIRTVTGCCFGLCRAGPQLRHQGRSLDAAGHVRAVVLKASGRQVRCTHLTRSLPRAHGDDRVRETARRPPTRPTVLQEQSSACARGRAHFDARAFRRPLHGRRARRAHFIEQRIQRFCGVES